MDNQDLVGGPRFEPGASRSRTLGPFVQKMPETIDLCSKLPRHVAPTLLFRVILQLDYYMKYYIAVTNEEQTRPSSHANSTSRASADEDIA